ncbi:hypothetical protein SD70_00800 [Gordoniibacillus kamchatkensis]|uniref:Lipoprotein n=1 Tax=Gordoniibacillus kamchatkensis TaxID=1590651 RepID=A0ABR5ANK9_9BACL|nr:hypothetical protein [Paenibacillus sp. VKM B-2647]KIL42473.1 hypothetical protein SD70_00800 [Paenibacillus sp. VKM B-2647]
MKATAMLTALGLAAVIALPACQQRAAQNQVKAQTAAPAPPVSQPMDGHTHINDASVIPSVGSPKVRTTNEHGGTSYGMGSSVYSVIGSSGLHSEGLSSHLESRLSGAGISDVKVLALDDMVILATGSRRPASSTYDAMQQQVLSGTSGMSGKTQEPGKSVGTSGTGPAGDDNLDAAEVQIKQFLGSNVKVYKVEGSQAVDTIGRIRANGSEGSVSPQAVADNVRTLLKLTLTGGK